MDVKSFSNGIFLFVFCSLFLNSLAQNLRQCGKNLAIDKLKEVVRIVTPSEDSESDELGTWPWMVSAGYTDRFGSWQHQCGGSVISNTLILTAAHCTKDDSWILRMGDRDLSKSSDDFGVITRKIKSTHRHPKFQSDTVRAYYDIAIWQVDHFDFNVYVRPICLPKPSSFLNKYSGHFVTLTGWGLTGSHRKDLTRGVLRRVPIRIYSQRFCNNSHTIPTNKRSIDKRISAFLPNRFQPDIMCAGYERGGGSCHGDSGSPLVKYETNDGEDPYYIQVGMVVGGVTECGDGQIPSVYIRLEDKEISDFISKTEQMEEKGGKEKAQILNLATKGGLYNIAEQVLKDGADPNFPDEKGKTPLHHACSLNNLKIIRLLLKDQRTIIDVPDNLHKTALFYCANSETFDGIVALVENGANLNWADARGVTPMMESAVNNDFKSVRFFLSNGAHLDAVVPTFDNRTILHLTCLLEHSVATEELISLGADITARDVFGYTPFMVACTFGNLENVNFFINRGYANFRDVDKNQRTSLFNAAEYGHSDVVKAILNVTTEQINTPDKNGSTPLHIAAYFGHQEVVQLLLEFKANRYLRNNEGKTAEDLARANGYESIAQILRNS